MTAVDRVFLRARTPFTCHFSYSLFSCFIRTDRAPAARNFNRASAAASVILL